MEHKDFQIEELKVAGDSGEFTGRASVFGVVDLVGDVVMAGAFTRTLAEKGATVPVLTQHDATRPIGMATVEQTETSLDVVEGKLLLDLVDAKQEHIRLKSGLVKGISIGFKTKQDKFEDGVRKVLDVDLWEISLVTFPANPLATVTTVKSLEQRLESVLSADVGSMSDAQVADVLKMAEALVAERKSLNELVEALVLKFKPKGEPPAKVIEKKTEEPEGNDDGEDVETKAALEELLASIREDNQS